MMSHSKEKKYHRLVCYFKDRPTRKNHNYDLPDLVKSFHERIESIVLKLPRTQMEFMIKQVLAAHQRGDMIPAGKWADYMIRYLSYGIFAEHYEKWITNAIEAAEKPGLTPLAQENYFRLASNLDALAAWHRDVLESWNQK